MNPLRSTSSFEDRVSLLTQELTSLRDPQERLAWLIRRPSAPQVLLDAGGRQNDHLVPGCASRFWLACTYADGRCHFACDSDSAILRSLGALLCEVYNDLAPTEIVNQEPDFLRRLGILDPLSENRRRTVQRLRERLRDFAKAAVA
ncbi:MAG: SufE family protein [Verrucomicrobiales bacterium]|nr:SufE family protein [Verrucomicrobiales bacterium]